MDTNKRKITGHKQKEDNGHKQQKYNKHKQKKDNCVQHICCTVCYKMQTEEMHQQVKINIHP